MIHRLLYTLLLILCAIPCHAENALPYKFLLATKGARSAYFLPTVHQSSDAMRERMSRTLRCFPDIGAIVTEVDAEAKFYLVGYSININKKIGQQLPLELLEPLDELSYKVLPRAFPRKAATEANKMGMHPAHFLYILRSKVIAPSFSELSRKVFGPSFESMLHTYAREKSIDELYLEPVTGGAAAYAAIGPADVKAEALYLLRISEDKQVRDAAYRAYDSAFVLFESGDWTTTDIQAINATMRATQTHDHVANVVVKRTQDMVARFEELPPRDKPALIAVGLGHFGKVDGIEAALEKRGYRLSYTYGKCQ